MGREERFRDLFDLNYHRVLGYAVRRTERREDAEDAVAETFAVAWRRLEDVPEGEGARPWLLGVARRVLSNQRRGEDRRARVVERLREAPSLHEAEEDWTGGATDVARAFNDLRAGDREVLALLSWEELTPSEIAVVIGCSQNAARKRVHRARRRLLKGLGLSARGDAATRRSSEPGTEKA